METRKVLIAQFYNFKKTIRADVSALFYNTGKVEYIIEDDEGLRKKLFDSKTAAFFYLKRSNYLLYRVIIEPNGGQLSGQ